MGVVCNTVIVDSLNLRNNNFFLIIQGWKTRQEGKVLLGFKSRVLYVSALIIVSLKCVITFQF